MSAKTTLQTLLFPVKKTAAFSLSEVALSIGILAFGLVSILGLLPVGMEQFRTASQTTNKQQIVDDLSAHLRQTNFNDVRRMYSQWASASDWNWEWGYKHFDIQGNELVREKCLDGTAPGLYTARIANINREGGALQGDNASDGFKGSFFVPAGARHGSSTAVMNPDILSFMIDVVYDPRQTSDPCGPPHDQRIQFIQTGARSYYTAIIGNGLNTAPVLSSN